MFGSDKVEELLRLLVKTHKDKKYVATSIFYLSDAYKVFIANAKK